MHPAVHPLAALLRRYAYAYTAAGDLSLIRELMTPDYTLIMGSHVLRGRDDAYLPAVERQLRQFPTLGFTVHDLVLAPDRAALRFTEHGRSARTGTLAAWTGVSLYTWNGTLLTSCRVEQDYESRRRQLTTGHCHPIPPPVPDPWTPSSTGSLAPPSGEPAVPRGAPAPPDADAEWTVLDWLATGGPDTAPAGWLDDEHTAPADRLVPPRATAEVLDLFSAGPQVAFHARLRGGAVTLHIAGIAQVAGGSVTHAHCVTDRLAARRRLNEP